MTIRHISEIVADLLDPDPCSLDHNGGCQAHGYLSLQGQEECPQAEAKQWLEEHKESAAEFTAAGGWCMPSEAIYNFSLPQIGIPRGGTPYLDKAPTLPPPLSRWERFTVWREGIHRRAGAVVYAVRKAWARPDGYWEED